MKWRRRRCGMPRRLFLKHFWSILEPKPTKTDSKHAPQRRVHARSVQKGPIDDRAHARKMRFEVCDPEHGKSSKMQEIMPDTIQEWPAEDVIFEAFLEYFGDKNTQTDSKHAPQRRVYARSVQKGPIDVPSGEAVRPSARPEDVFFRTSVWSIWEASPRRKLIRKRVQRTDRWAPWVTQELVPGEPAGDPFPSNKPKMEQRNMATASVRTKSSASATFRCPLRASHRPAQTAINGGGEGGAATDTACALARPKADACRGLVSGQGGRTT
eukprot:gene20100-biopygen19089